MRILVLEDDVVIRELLKELLAGLGREIDVAEDCRSALALAEAKEYDAVTFDLSLPDGCGWQLLEALRRSGRFRGKAFVISGEAESPEHLETAKRLRPDAVFAKPFPPSELLQALENRNGEEAEIRQKAN